MAEGTRYAKIDDAIKSLNKFRKETETQIRELNNTITRFMQAVNQRMENRAEVDRSTKHTQITSHVPNNNNTYLV